MNWGVYLFLGVGSVMCYDMKDNSATSIALPTQASLVFATCEQSNATKTFLSTLTLLFLCYDTAVKALKAS